MAGGPFAHWLRGGATVLFALASTCAPLPAHGETTCPQGQATTYPNGSTLCVHGEDPAPPGEDPTQPKTTRTVAAAAASEAGTATLSCSGDGHDGYRVQWIYALPAGHSDRFEAFRGIIQNWSEAMNQAVRESAAQTGGNREIRFVTTPDCTVDVARADVSPGATVDFDQLVTDLMHQGFEQERRRYLIAVDAESPLCGLGHVSMSEEGAEPAYGAIFNSCGGSHTALHELGHTLGAVQLDAPNSNGHYHCTDDHDVMCYPEHGVPVRQVCPGAHEHLFDCNHDDYFHTSPPPGHYLEHAINVADSPYLGGGATPPPSEPHDAFADALAITDTAGSVALATHAATAEAGEPSHAGQGAARSVWLRWSAPQDGLVRFDTYGSDFDTVLGVYEGDSLDGLTELASSDDSDTGDVGPAGTHSSAYFQAIENVTYMIAVDGWGGSAGNAVVSWRILEDPVDPDDVPDPDPDEDLPDPDPEPDPDEDPPDPEPDPDEWDDPDDPTWTVQRVAGRDRFATAAEWSARHRAAPAYAVLAVNGFSFADALAAAAAAPRFSASTLLTAPDSVPSSTSHELGRLAPEIAIGVGGRSVLPEWVASEVEDYTRSGDFFRAAGGDRYETAAILSRWAFPEGAPVVVVASGEHYADAVVAASAAVARSAPLVLVAHDTLPESTAAEIERLAPREIVLVGGTGVVSTWVSYKLSQMAQVTRLAGADRYHTAALVAEWAHPAGHSEALLATGVNWPDAFIAAQSGLPLLLIPPSRPPDVIGESLTSLGTQSVTVVGGHAAVPEWVIDSI